MLNLSAEVEINGQEVNVSMNRDAVVVALDL
jgi:hypothetical protein